MRPTSRSATGAPSAFAQRQNAAIRRQQAAIELADGLAARKMTDPAPKGIVQAGEASLQSHEMGFDNEILHEISSLNHKPPCISGLAGLRPVPTPWHIAHSPSFGSR